jgi:hypothetical protein
VDIRSIVVKPVVNDKGELVGVRQENGTRLHLKFATTQVDGKTRAGVEVAEKFSGPNRARAYQFRCPADVERVNLDEAAASQPSEGDSN